MAKTNKVIEKNGVIYQVSRVEGHPKKKEIDRDLIDRIPYTTLEKKYGISKAVLSNYYKKKIIPQLSKVIKEERLENVDRILDRLEVVCERSTKLLNACDKWLTDPNNDDEYNLDPRGSELEVVFNVFTDNGKKIRQKDTLQRILNRLEDEGNIDVVRVVSKIADPRELILKTSNTILEELKLIGQITGELKNVTNEVNINVLNSNISNIILEATSNNLGIQDAIIQKLQGAIQDAESQEQLF